MTKLIPHLTALFLFAFCISSATSDQVLKEGWLIQSSASVTESGEQISSTLFKHTGWYSTTVPSTVLAALVRNDVYRDLYYGRNLETVSPEPFKSSWWYRREFDLDASLRAERVHLIFDGINYSANIFVNGTKVASADNVLGSFRRFSVDISRLARKKKNVLAVEVFPPKPGDFTIGFVDWNPLPPDRNMGLWREVKLRATGPVTLEDPFVQSKLDLNSMKDARLTITGTLTNHSNSTVSGTISGEIDGGITFAREYSLAPKEAKEFRFDADKTPQLLVHNPRVWWPNNLGAPELYQLKIAVQDARGLSDARNVTFGIREVADYINEAGHRGYIVNGKKVLIRGGGWVDDLLLSEDERNLEAQVRYAKHLNLNTIRLEGFWGSSEKLYELADRYGLLIMVGFSCQWEWTHYLGKEADEPFGGVQTEEDMQLVTQYLHDQVLWLRNHPSIFVWALASDMLPNPDLEKRERNLLAAVDPSRPILSSTKSWTSEISGPSAVKMNGPYDYVTPNYWYEDKDNGGAFGFNTETGPGPQPPPEESIRRMFSAEHYWPIDDTWDFHSGRNEFSNIQKYMNAFNKRYGEAEDFEDFAKKAQAANYEAIRPMFESFGIRKPLSTGIVQWMLNAAWPKMFWQLYDYYLMPGGAFYGARKANQPVNIAYDYSNHSIYVVNDTYASYSSLHAEVRMLSLQSKDLQSQTLKTSIGPNESKQIYQLTPGEDAAPVCFLSLKLKDSDGNVIADNFYWLSSKADVLDTEGTEWYYTPNKEYADFTALKELPAATVHVEQHLLANGISVVLTNTGANIAFFIELKIVGARSGRSVLPVFWDDNYISLLPGESKSLIARFSPQDLRGETPLLQYSAWNVKFTEPDAAKARASCPACLPELVGARASRPPSLHWSIR